MNEESFVPTLSKDEMYLSSRQKRIDSKRHQREEEEKIYKERELNRHMKSGEAGLPEKETNVQSLSLPSTSVGDCGYSWLKKTYYRIQEQAQSEGRPMEEVAVERWGEHQKLAASLERCEYCLDQPHNKKYLVVDIGEQVYLCLPNFQTLTDGHCLIVPKTHTSSFLSLDKNEWKEVNDFKNQLRRFFRSDNKSVLFLETSMNYRYFCHAVVECIPVPKEESDMAPFYFKKAIQESETEWAHNKKLVDLTKKGLWNSIPKGLPYFHIEFDPEVHAGYAHVIEDEKYFPKNFGKEVIGGMLDVDYNYLYKNKREEPLKKLKDVAVFEKKWKKFKNAS